jgi:cobalt/nickel transport system permease protein
VTGATRMHHDFIDRYSRLASPVHRARPGFKVAFTLTVLLSAVATAPGQLSQLFVPALCLLALVAASRVPVMFLATRLALLEPFVLSVALLSFLQPGGTQVFIALLARGTLCLLAVIVLSNTTAFADLLRVLRALRVPVMLVTTLALMYRYVFVLVDEAERMQRARASRTFSRRTAHLWHTRATVVGQLFVRSTERAEHIYAAMCARGWKT